MFVSAASARSVLSLPVRGARAPLGLAFPSKKGNLPYHRAGGQLIPPILGAEESLCFFFNRVGRRLVCGIITNFQYVMGEYLL